MAWEVHRVHEYRYPDQGYTVQGCYEEDERAYRENPAEHPDAAGWRLWYYRHCRPEEGSGSGVLPDVGVIDFHTHIWNDSFAPRMRAYYAQKYGVTAFEPGTMGGLRERRRSFGITTSVVLPVPTKPSQVPLFNDWLKDYLHDPDFMPFMGIIREMDDPVAEVHRCAQLGFKGVKFHPINQHFRMDDPRMFPIYEACIEEDLVMLFHTGPGVDYAPAGVDWDCSPWAIEGFFNKFPYEKTVLAHLGGSNPDFTRAPELHPEWPGYLDTAFELGRVPNDVLLDLVRGFGTDRVLFGTDSPWEDAADFLVRMAHIGFTDEELRAILHDNAAKLLKLD